MLSGNAHRSWRPRASVAASMSSVIQSTETWRHCAPDPWGSDTIDSQPLFGSLPQRIPFRARNTDDQRAPSSMCDLSCILSRIWCGAPPCHSRSTLPVRDKCLSNGEDTASPLLCLSPVARELLKETSSFGASATQWVSHEFSHTNTFSPQYGIHLSSLIPTVTAIKSWSLYIRSSPHLH